MAQKNATPSKEQQAVMKRNGINPLLFVVVQDLEKSMIIKHRVSGEFKMINK